MYLILFNNIIRIQSFILPKAKPILDAAHRIQARRKGPASDSLPPIQDSQQSLQSSINICVENLMLEDYQKESCRAI